MRTLERGRPGALALLLLGAATLACAADEPLLRHRAPIVVERSAAFVQLALPAAAYANIQQRGLQDLRVVDARGERVPFALLAPRADAAQTREQAHAAAIYPLPPRPAGSTGWATPLELSIEAGRIRVRPAETAGPNAGANAGAVTAATAPPPGWLVDLGDPAERTRDTPPPQALDLQWSGPAEFSVGVTLEVSDDLRVWRPAGRSQVMALAAPAGALTQPRLTLPAAPGRFVRLVWDAADAAPRLSGAQAVSFTRADRMLDPPAEIEVAALPATAAAATDAASAAALDFDLGARLPLVQIELEFGAGTRVAPVRLLGRESADEPWQPLAGAVFYRIERAGEVERSPPLRLQRSLRYLRVQPDARSGALDPASTRLRVRAQLASLVFAAQGEPPYALLAGSAHAPAGALPLTTLLPLPEQERERFGRARLGAWSEDDAAVRQAEAEQRRAFWRPWLLWGVLVAGVLGLAALVWQLARAPRKA